MIETLGKIYVKDMIKELEDKTKATYNYLSISGRDYSWDHFPETTNKYMLRKMVINNLAESSFAGVTSQVQTYGHIGICNDAYISDMSRNGYLTLPTTKKYLK